MFYDTGGSPEGRSHGALEESITDLDAVGRKIQVGMYVDSARDHVTAGGIDYRRVAMLQASADLGYLPVRDQQVIL
jgi:hypothetical protein